MKRKIFSLFLTLGLAATLFLSGCNKNDNALTAITLNEVAHSIFYAPQYVAIELGYFEEEGLDITLVNGGGADKVMTALISNDAQIGFMGSEASIYVYAEGSDDYAINFAQLTQRAGNFLVAREADADFNWSKLVGKEVLGGRAGGMPQMVFEYILKKNGIDPQKDLTIVQNINFGLTAGAFSGGQADYTVEFEPFATSLEVEGKGHVVASLGVDSGYVPYTAYCAKKSYLEANPEVIQSFTNAIQKGIDYVNSHTAKEVAEVIAPQFAETSVENITIIIERYKEQDTWKNDTIFTEESFNLLQDILTEAGELSEKVPYSKLVITEYSEKALSFE
ncbi:MAG: ABC transporter substrate-binding protein [Lachnospiraceae bacterium]|nr:ABC transporter substrate-binding protein [Lachnospiraceae bacterium]